MGHPQGTKTQGDGKVIKILCRAISVFLFRFRIIFYLFSFNMLHIIYIAYDTKQKIPRILYIGSKYSRIENHLLFLKKLGGSIGKKL